MRLILKTFLSPVEKPHRHTVESAPGGQQNHELKKLPAASPELVTAILR
jgi:hypothetical protein